MATQYRFQIQMKVTEEHGYPERDIGSVIINEGAFLGLEELGARMGNRVDAALNVIIDKANAEIAKIVCEANE